MAQPSDKSYWTKRRRIVEEVNRYIREIEFEEHDEESLGLNNHDNDEEPGIIDPNSGNDTEELDNVLDEIYPFQDQNGEMPSEEPTDSDYYSHDGSDDSSDELSDPDLSVELSDWVATHNITHAACSTLLDILKPHHPDLPKDPRTLLGTVRKVNVQNISGGEYYHFGLKSTMIEILNLYGQIIGDQISIQINIDGLPLHKSSNTQFWPILGMIDQLPVKDPFIIGLFSGDKKPTSPKEYLEQFVEEVSTLERDDIHYKDQIYQFRISAVICDTPARAYVKNVKGHAGYSGCDKCTQEGEWMGKMTYQDSSAPLRTDDTFDEMRDEDHHLGPSPFEGTSLKMVSQFPLDYMHLVCLGMMRKLLYFWMKGPLKNRVSSRTVGDISTALLQLKGCIPREFARKPRGLKEVDRWKATEFRQFLIYTGPLVLCRALSDVQYKNFMLLFAGIFILLCPTLCSIPEWVKYAEDLLVLFVEHYAKIYGKESLVYNVHGLLHLANDVREYGCLDNISAFPFESFLARLKRMVRKPGSPLQQVVRRLSERAQSKTAKHNKPTSTDAHVLKEEHDDGPIPRGYAATQQFKKLFLNTFCIGINAADNCVKIGEEICLVGNIFVRDRITYVVYKQFKQKRSYFNYPLDSQALGIYQVSELSQDWSVSVVPEIKKYVHLLHGGVHVAVPLLHVF